MFMIIGAALMLAGAMKQSQAQGAAGKAEYAAALYEQTLAAGRRAEALDQQAGQVRAASQRGAIEETRQADLAASRSRAVAGASGAGVGTDQTVVQNIGDIGFEGELRALTSIYQGEEYARGLEYDAELERARGRGLVYGGKVAKELSGSQSRSTLLSGAGQAFGMFGGG